MAKQINWKKSDDRKKIGHNFKDHKPGRRKYNKPMATPKQLGFIRQLCPQAANLHLLSKYDAMKVIDSLLNDQTPGILRGKQILKETA